MVSFTDLKVYRSTSDLGGPITATQIQSGTPNNLFSSIPRSEYVAGTTYYKCVYFKNTNTTESMDDFKLWLSSGTPSPNTSINFAFDDTIKNSMSFDGVNDFINCTNDATLWSQSLTKFSFSFWIYPTKDGVGGSNLEIVTHGGTSAQAFRCILPNNANRVTFQVRNSVGTAFEAFSDSLVVNSWNYITCVYDNSLGSANVKIYVAGVVGGTTANLTEAINLSSELRLGNSSTDFQGYMKDFRWWTTTALTQAQVELVRDNDPAAPTPNYWLKLDQSEPYRFGPYGTYNGTTDFTSYGDVHSMSGNMSVFAWARTSKDYTIAVEDGIIVNKGGTGSNPPNSNYNLRVFKETNMLRGGFETSSGVDHEPSSSPITVNDGQWHMHGFTNDGFKVRLYLDGVQVKQHTYNPPDAHVPETNTQPLVIGRNSNDSTRFFQGDIDEVRIWNRVLTVGEISQLYKNNVAPSSGLVFEEKFGADNNNPIDQISGTKVGTLTNGALFISSIAQTIANVNTAPTGVTWYNANAIPPSIGVLSPGQYFPIWVKLTVNATATADPAIDDAGIFTAQFDIPQGGTGTGGTPGTGGGTGGNPPPTATDYKIAIAGDWGCEPETDDVIDLIQEQDYDLVVGVGDNAYESASCWINRFDDIKSIFKVSAYGNHEYSESGGTSPYRTFFGHTRTYNKFKFQNIMFFAIDSNDDRSGVDLDAQVDWLTDELEAIKNDSTITWRIVTMHHPWFGSSSDHSYNEFDQVQKFHQLCITYKVSLVYTGHNHNWQRSKQVAYNSGSPTSPTVVDSSSPYSRNTAGLIHIVTGTGGHDTGSSLYDLDTNPSFNGYQNNDHNGVHELEASNNGQTLTGRFRNTDGDTFDEFIINA